MRVSSTPRFGDTPRADGPAADPAAAAGEAAGAADALGSVSAPTGGSNLYDRLPPLPAAVLDPRPALALGTAIWLVIAIVLLVLGGWSRTVALCLAGIAVGVLGTAVYALQRRAVVRGARGSQQGLDFDQS